MSRSEGAYASFAADPFRPFQDRLFSKIVSRKNIGQAAEENLNETSSLTVFSAKTHPINNDATTTKVLQAPKLSARVRSFAILRFRSKDGGFRSPRYHRQTVCTAHSPPHKQHTHSTIRGSRKSGDIRPLHICLFSVEETFFNLPTQSTKNFAR